MVMTALWVYLLGLCYSCIKDNPAGNVPLLPVVPTAMVMSIFCCADHPRLLSIAVGCILLQNQRGVGWYSNVSHVFSRFH